jgi:hypothetical protein
MKLAIEDIKHPGNYTSQVVHLKVLEDCNLKYYMIMDTTYNPDQSISNELRHTYWFRPYDVKKGDYVFLYTKKGAQKKFNNQAKTVTHEFYWGLKESVWNKDGDAAVLFEIAAWNTTRVPKAT